MDAIIERVGGVDVGQATVVATVLVGGAHERAKKETRTFRAVTRELLEMREWFIAKGVTQHRRHPPKGPCHLSLMGRTGWWGVTCPAQQHERNESMIPYRKSRIRANRST